MIGAPVWHPVTQALPPCHLHTYARARIPLRTTAYQTRQKCGASISHVLLRRIQGLVFLLTPDADISLSGSDTLYADTLYPAIGEVGLDSLPGVRMCVCNDASVYVRTYTSHVTTLLQGGDYVVGGIVPGLIRLGTVFSYNFKRQTKHTLSPRLAKFLPTTERS